MKNTILNRAPEGTCNGAVVDRGKPSGVFFRKKAKKVMYWISYILPNGIQRRECVDAVVALNGYSIEDARDAFAKRRVDKKENRMFDNDIVSGRTLKTFKRVKKLLVPGSDVRNRIISPDEFKALMENSEGHIKAIIATGYHTGHAKR